jgi:hypothetical protein
MKLIRKLALAAVVAIAMAVVAVGSMGPGKADAAGTEVDCYFFNGLQWRCDITNPAGISHVNLNWDNFDITLWDQSYFSCPTKVTIGPWGDEVAGDMTLDVDACSGVNLKAGGGDRDDLGLKARETAAPKTFDIFTVEGGRQFGIAVPLPPPW